MNANDVYRDSLALPAHQLSSDAWSIEFLRGVAALIVVFAHYQSLVGFDMGILRSGFTGSIYSSSSVVLFLRHIFFKKKLMWLHIS